MSDDPITSNTAWNELRDAANEGRISARDALEKTLERANAVHGGQLAAIMLWFREQDAKEAARDKNRDLVVQYLERLEAAATEQRSMFQSLFEIVNGHTLDIGDLKQTVAEHDREIASFRQSRDASIAERRQLAADLVASKDDRAKIHEELRVAADERKAITAALARIEARLPAGDD